MEIKAHHRALLKAMGLHEEDVRLFDGKDVDYRYDEEKGVRIYDPYYRTSYNEYIDVDGWSSWSSERDTFMRDILKGAREKAKESEEMSARPTEEDIAGSLRKKFGTKAEPGSCPKE